MGMQLNNFLPNGSNNINNFEMQNYNNGFNDGNLQNPKKIRSGSNDLDNIKVIAPILIKNTSDLEPEKFKDKIAFDLNLEELSGANIKYSKFDVNKNLLVFPKTQTDYESILKCKNKFFSNEKIEFGSNLPTLIIKGMTYTLANKYIKDLNRFYRIDC